MTAMFASSFTAALMYPNMFDPPDPVNPTLILYVFVACWRVCSHAIAIAGRVSKNCSFKVH